MKTLIKTLFVTGLFGLMFTATLTAQQSRDMQNFRYNDKRGVNEFESPKTTDVPFEGLKVRMGASNTLQFQAIDHENSGAVPLAKLGYNFNLATSNLDVDVALYDGVRMHLRTYLSSRHHPEPYVKDGYMQIDKLDFIQEGFLSDLMQYVTIKVGHMEVNYGDNHFRRTDNAQAIFNPFVGNYLMDSFTTEVAGEVYFRYNGFLVMGGLSNGKLNQSVKVPATGVRNTHISLLGKLGYDSRLNEDLRVRLTGSVYHTDRTASAYLYSGDRAGARYYGVMDVVGDDNFASGRINPGLSNQLTAVMINPFIKFHGLEIYGVFENATGKALAESKTRTFTQLGGELLYRFSVGNEENVYLGGRYNTVSGTLPGNNKVSVDRINVGGGWFMTKNILAKAEYVLQNYNDYPVGAFQKGRFNGFMVEAVISF